MANRILVLFICLLAGLSLQAQIPVQYIGTTNNRVIIRNQGRSDSAWGLPNLKTTTNLMSGQLAYNKDFRGLEVYDTATARWYSILSLQLRDGLISGGNVSWTGSGLNFFVSESVYVIGGVLYFGNDTTVTLATADGTNPRQDVIALNNIGVFVLTGTPAADPAKPQVTPGIELELTSILVAAGATTPTGITQAVIYDENTESTVTSGFTINADNTSNVYRGSKSINASSHGANDVIAFEFDNAIDLTEYSLLTFHINLKAEYANNVGFNIKWINKNGFLQSTISSNVTITNNNYNYNRTTDGLYQTIQIPLSAFLFNSAPTSVDIMEITMTNSGGGFYLDYVNLQGGVNIPSSGVVSFNDRAGNVTSAKNDYDQWFPDTSYTRNDSVFWIINGAEVFQHLDAGGGGSGGVAYTLINGGANIGSGVQYFKDTSSNKLNFRTGTAGWGLDVTQNTNDNEYKADTAQLATGTALRDTAQAIRYLYSGESFAWGTYAQRVALTGLIPGQRFYQTDERIGEWVYTGNGTTRGWNFDPPNPYPFRPLGWGALNITVANSGAGSGATYTQATSLSDSTVGFLTAIHSGTGLNSYTSMRYLTQNYYHMPIDSNVVTVSHVRAKMQTAPSSGNNYIFKFGIVANSFGEGTDSYGSWLRISQDSIYLVTDSLGAITANKEYTNTGLDPDDLDSVYVDYTVVANMKQAWLYINGVQVATTRRYLRQLGAQIPWFIRMENQNGSASRMIHISDGYTYVIRRKY